MTLSTIFKKPIDRPIEGVIKADDEEHLCQEVEEYVLTNEVAKRLEAFLDAYNNSEGSSGAWISGFFAFVGVKKSLKSSRLSISRVFSSHNARARLKRSD